MNQRAVQPGGFPVGQHVREQIELGVPPREKRRRTPRQVEAGQLDPVLEHQPDFLVPRRDCASRLDRRRRLTRLDVFEVPSCKRDGAIRLDITGKRERGVARVIVGLEELTNVLQPCRAQVLSRADR